MIGISYPWPNMPAYDTIIIGGGMAGTALAIRLHRENRSVLLLEASPRLGGKVDTLTTDGGCFEFGPNSFTDQCPEILDFISMLGRSSDILSPSPAARKRYILRNGQITRLPGGPQEILTTQALSLSGKLRFLLEPFYVPRKRVERESVYDFFRRHFGREVAEYFADPFVSGVYAGDVRKLSLEDAFPTMAGAERLHGSLIRYMIAQKKTGKATPQSFQILGGLSSLFRTAEELLGREYLHLKEAVTGLKPAENGFRIITKTTEYFSQRVCLATPADTASRLLNEHCPEASRLLAGIHYASVVVAHLRVPKSSAYPFDGFGLLIPSSEKCGVLGILWNSSTFPEMFSDCQHHYLTAFAGGAHHPEICSRNDEELRSLFGAEAQRLFALTTPPEILHLRRHPQAIPQYTIGHGDRIAALKKALADCPHLHLAGNYLEGISLPKTVAQAMRIVP